MRKQIGEIIALYEGYLVHSFLFVWHRPPPLLLPFYLIYYLIKIIN